MTTTHQADRKAFEWSAATSHGEILKYLTTSWLITMTGWNESGALDKIHRWLINEGNLVWLLGIKTELGRIP